MNRVTLLSFHLVESFLGRSVSLRIYLAVLAVVGIVFAGVYFASYPRPLDYRPNFTDPKANADYVLTQRWSDRFSYQLPFSDQLPESLQFALTPRDAAFAEGKVVPKEFGGAVILFGALQAIGSPLVLLAVPVLAVLAAAMVSLITYELFGTRAAILAYILWLVFPPFWINSIWIVTPDIPALLLLLAGVYLVLRYVRERDNKWIVAASVALSLAIALRYPHAFLVLPFVVVMLAYRSVLRSAIPRAAVAVLPTAGVLLLFNKLVYGDFLTTGQQVLQRGLDNSVNFSSSVLFSFDLGAFLALLRTYFTNPVLFLPMYVGVVGSYFVVGRQGDRGAHLVVAFAAIASLILVVYYGGRYTWGAQAFFLNSSFLRYFLPATALWMPVCAAFISELIKRQAVVTLTLVGIVLGASVFITYNSQGGISELQEDASFVGKIRWRVVGLTEPNALVVTRLMDKALFPERQTVTATYLVHNPTPMKQDKLLYHYVPEPDQLVTAIAALTQTKAPVYVLNDGVIRKVPQVETLLSTRGYKLQHLADIGNTALYRITDTRQEGVR